ncbi:hypothetical protein D4764_12G0011930 [Takifugu flavidus]|uniref:Uncharacterized protein n=1 Tax=Takifugu flavidus TaxID=433684 RepID=A0A5C6PE73_9TELE|nr:hypothetical protein D4764_12G0011930 [Takifugu flavidus]
MGAKESRIGFLSYDEAVKRGELCQRSFLVKICCYTFIQDGAVYTMTWSSMYASWPTLGSPLRPEWPFPRWRLHARGYVGIPRS